MVSLPTMNRLFVIITISLLLTACHTRKTKQQPRTHFTTDVMLKITPVKNQGKSALCWAYAMLATIETEHLMRGDSVHLSVDYVTRSMFREQAQWYYLTQGSRKFTQRGMASGLLHLISSYGLLAYDTYREPLVNISVLERKLAHTCDMAIAQRAGWMSTEQRISHILDQTLGYLPRAQFMFSAQYTPHQFARSVCRENEYKAITSFTHHPFYTSFVLEVPDNIYQDTFLNLPLDSMMSVIERTVRSGHPVCWEGDISEPGFCFEQGVARLKNQPHTITQTLRQHAFETFRTTDDHCMTIVGLAHDSKGNKFFICKNSWGTDNPFNGLMYVSYNYIKLKTIAIWVPTPL